MYYMRDLYMCIGGPVTAKYQLLVLLWYIIKTLVVIGVPFPDGEDFSEF